MDHYFWVDLFILPYLVDDTKHVYHFGAIEKTDGEVLWNQIYCLVRLFRSIVFCLCRHHVPGPMGNRPKGMERNLSKLGVVNLLAL